MPLNASEFVLPGFGGNAGEGLTSLSQKLWMRNIQTQRLQLAQEGKREQAGNFLKDYLNPEHYLSGTAYDPVTVKSLGSIMERLSGMAEQGADIPSLLQAAGPDVAKLSEYTQKAKVVKSQLENGIKQMRESGVKGVDFQKAYDRAQRLAFHDVDPQTGKESLKNPSDVDMGTDYLQQAIVQHPDDVMNGGDIQAFAKALPVNKTLSDIKQYDAGGGVNSSRVHLVAPKTFVPEVNDDEVTTGMVPRHEIFTDNGKPVMHPFTDAKGQTTQAPVRMLDENDFDAMLQEKPLISNYLQGEVKKHWPEYEGGKPYDPHSADAKRIARAFAYDEMNRGASTDIQNAEVQGKPSAQQVMMHLYGGLEQRAYDRSYGGALGKYDANVDGLIPGKANTVDTMHQIAKLNPDFLHGDLSEQNGRAVMDVSPMLNKAKLKYGPGSHDQYQNVFFDPKDQTFLLRKQGKDAPLEEVGLKDLPNLLYKIAQPNGVPGGGTYVRQSLGRVGFANGKYSDTGEAPDLAESLNNEKALKVKEALDIYQEGGEKKIPKTLVGLHTPDGTLQSIDTHGGVKQFFGSDPYELKLTSPQGKPISKPFKSRDAMEAYLKQSTLKSGAAPAATGAAGAKLTPEEEKALKEQGL